LRRTKQAVARETSAALATSPRLTFVSWFLFTSGCPVKAKERELLIGGQVKGFLRRLLSIIAYSVSGI
jgi:hypothetical protein